jgi:hypothetical protein
MNTDLHATGDSRSEWLPLGGGNIQQLAEDLHRRSLPYVPETVVSRCNRRIRIVASDADLTEFFFRLPTFFDKPTGQVECVKQF